MHADAVEEHVELELDGHNVQDGDKVLKVHPLRQRDPEDDVPATGGAELRGVQHQVRFAPASSLMALGP